MQKYSVYQVSDRAGNDKHTQDHCGPLPFDIPVKSEEQENKAGDRDQRKYA